MMRVKKQSKRREAAALDEERGQMAQPRSLVFDLSLAGLWLNLRCVSTNASTRWQRYAQQQNMFYCTSYVNVIFV